MNDPGRYTFEFRIRNEARGVHRAIPIELSSFLARDACQSLELSDDPQMLAMSGQAQVSRDVALAERRLLAERLAKQLAALVVEEFAKLDVLNGYKVNE